ncbi:hypothetical protein IG193_06635 [Infirmifilum lucidum]|uniref:Uncharacterized protein n=1 Tax=Infirmifilum lucidum TaxID=2776706 RepID=A0A7L9FFH5_9CREN|nr:hypothetical protein [Infirmifilum lucidum]QOJ78427.1 hypothetical protein IG193_06635 [Infirmifilum lucidum]
MSEKDVLAIALLLLFVLAVLFLQLPVAYKATLVVLLALASVGYSTSREDVIEVSASAMYLLLVTLVAFDQLGAVQAMFIALLLLLLRDSLEILTKGALSGTRYILGWYTPFYFALLLIPLAWPWLHLLPRKIPAVLLGATILVILYVVHNATTERP